MRSSFNTVFDYSLSLRQEFFNVLKKCLLLTVIETRPGTRSTDVPSVFKAAYYSLQLQYKNLLNLLIMKLANKEGQIHSS